jgi:hypothetical protein
MKAKMLQKVGRRTVVFLADHPTLKMRPDPDVMDQIEAECGTVERWWSFPVLYQGWEMDYVGYVAQLADGTFRAYTTNHGEVTPLDVVALRQSVDELADALTATMAAAALVSNGGKKS